MSSFAGASFDVITERFGPLPDITREAGSPKRYSVRVSVDTQAALDALMDRFTWADLHAPAGTTGYNVHIQAGYGAGTLAMMTGYSEERSVTAILIGITGIESSGRAPLRITATLDFLVPS